VGQRGTVRAGDYNFLYGRGDEDHKFVTGDFIHQRIISAVKTEFF
jgi:hypothetical protein